jgi:hypothetical protein
MTAELWMTIPDPDGNQWYECSDQGRVNTLPHEVVKSDGRVHTVKGRPRRISVTKNGQRHVLLATGRRRHYRFVDVDRLVSDLFGDEQEAEAA